MDRARMDDKREPLKLCWWCKHFCYSPGSGGYSEMTPGWDMSMSCAKNKWEFSNIGTSEEEFRDNLMMANDCKDYKLDIDKTG